MSLVQPLNNSDGHVSFNVDADGDGFVDGSAYYQLLRDGNPIDLTNRAGRTFSDSSSRNWNAIKAIDSGSGFQVLLAGSSRLDGRFGVWDVNSSGVISSFSRWRSTSQALEDGWESLFGDVIQPDGTIGSPFNNGAAEFQIVGTPEINQTLRADIRTDDPDGNGSFSYTWQSSNSGGAWSNVDGGSEQLLRVDSSLSGQSIRVIVTYTDGEGFDETVVSEVVEISTPEDGGDVRGDIDTTANLSANSSRTGDLQEPGDRDWFKISLESAETYQFDLVGNSLFDPQLNLRNQDGVVIASNDDSGPDLDSRITHTPTNSGTFFLDAGAYADFYAGTYTLSAIELDAPSNDGSANFTINGTPQVNGSLSADLITSDPDGDGTFTYSWEASLDESTWTEIGTSESINNIPSSLNNYLVRVRINYTDGEDFLEEVVTEAVRIRNTTSDDDFSSDTSTTGIVSIGSSTTGNLEETGDHDWFAINLQAGLNYQFDVQGITLSDTYLYLRDSSGDLVKSDDDGGDGLNSRITFTPSTSARYFLDVGSYDDSFTGTYSISAQQLSSTTPNPDEAFSSSDGYGEMNAARAFEELLEIDIPNVPTLGGNLWGLDNINAPDVWNGAGEFSGTKGSGAIVAVIDTGVDLDHPEFSGRIVAGYDFVDNDAIADDGEGHGTHVAGTIAGSDSDGVGISGVAPDSQIMPIRVLGDDGTGWTSDIVAGIRWAADQGADVINLSLGGGGYSPTMADAIRYASNKNSVVVMAAGNSGYSSPEYPAAHAVNNGIAVGAVNQDRNLASFSNRAGSDVLDYVTAPGVNIYSSIPGGSYDYYSGTSMATPHVAGVAALLKSHDNSLTSESIEDLIIGTASNNLSSSSTRTFNDSITNNRITSNNINDLTTSDYSGRLIGSLSGNMASRKETIKDLKLESRENKIISDVDVISSTRKSLVTIDLSGADEVTSGQIVKDWLSNNQFDYFEIDTKMSIV